MNAVTICFKKYIDLIHKRQKNYLESGKETQRYYIVIDELIALIASANKTASDTLKQQLGNDMVIGRSSNALNSYSARLNVASRNFSTTLRNQISVKSVRGRPSTACNIFPRHILSSQQAQVQGLFRQIQQWMASLSDTSTDCRKGGRAMSRLIQIKFMYTLTVETSYLDAHSLKIYVINIIPSQNTHFLKKYLFLGCTHIGALNAYWLLAGQF